MNNEIVCLICKNSTHTYPKYFFNNFKVFFCNFCLNGFTYPVPKDMGKYYPDNYWQMPGIIGGMKAFLNDYFQSRRAKWVKGFLKNGQVLDVGAGEAIFAKKLTGFKVISIDTPGSKIKNKEVLKVDYTKWKTDKKFEAIVFWESLEHVPDPAKYLKKSRELLEKDGLIFIECPRFDSIEAKIFGRNWYHLDPPRHLVHLSREGLKRVLERQV